MLMSKNVNNDVSKDSPIDVNSRVSSVCNLSSCLILVSLIQASPSRFRENHVFSAALLRK